MKLPRDTPKITRQEQVSGTRIVRSTIPQQPAGRHRMTEYTKISAEDAATDCSNVVVLQAGGWEPVDRVTINGNTAFVHFTNGGSHVAPVHFFTFSRQSTDLYDTVHDIRDQFIGETDDMLTYKERSSEFDNLFIGALYSVIGQLCKTNAEADRLIIDAAELIANEF